MSQEAASRTLGKPATDARSGLPIEAIERLSACLDGGICRCKLEIHVEEIRAAAARGASATAPTAA